MSVAGPPLLALRQVQLIQGSVAPQLRLSRHIEGGRKHEEGEGRGEGGWLEEREGEGGAKEGRGAGGRGEGEEGRGEREEGEEQVRRDSSRGTGGGGRA